MESSNFAQLIKQETLTSHAHYDVDVPLPPLPPNPSITSFCNSLVSADDSFLAPPKAFTTTPKLPLSFELVPSIPRSIV